MAVGGRESLHVDLLLKDELIYELMLRGRKLSGVETVRDLRKTLRLSLKNFELPNYLNIDSKLTAQSELDTIMLKINSLSEDIPDIVSKEHVKSLDVARLDTKLNHIRTRLHNLQYSQIGDTNKEIAIQLQTKISELCKDLEIVKVKIGEDKLKLAIEQLSVSNIEEEQLLDSKNHTPKSSTENLNKIQHSTPKQNLVNLNPDEVNLSLQNNQVSQVPVYQHQVQMFAPLPNPINIMLKNFKITNGLNTSEFLDFISQTIKLKLETNLTDSQILSLIVGYTQGPLLTKILELKSVSNDLDIVHTSLLNYFLPPGLREHLKRDLVLRPQFNNEPLAVYIDSVKMNSKILKLNYSESELVESIKFGICPADRAKLVFMNNPQSFADLDQVVINSHNVLYNDFERECKQKTLQQNQQSNPKYVTPKSLKECYFCKKRGHIAKNCFSKQKQLESQSKNY